MRSERRFGATNRGSGPTIVRCISLLFPSTWLVTLRGTDDVIEVWADVFARDKGFYVFSALADATGEEQSLVEVTGRTPTNPARVIVTVARFPISMIKEPRSA